ncbi:MBL fold metallo-hydrolase [Taibaiella chishuiensis]|nr:MBL fold metallo-hydrolase [Taibaiella chishuiensis]
MMKPILRHLNCVDIVLPDQSPVCGHCLLLQEHDRLVLIDTGIGLLDTQNPQERIGKPLIDAVGYRFDERNTAIRQIEGLGLDPARVTDCIISHLDNDHTGGLPDFPKARVHLGSEELDNFHAGNPRYLAIPLAHQPELVVYPPAVCDWFGFEARRIEAGLDTEIYLIPLFGHTLGHCGIALRIDDAWLLYVADAYYLRAELDDENHPVGQLAAMRADDNALRITTLGRIRDLVRKHPELSLFGYHDPAEFIPYAKK